MLMKPDKKNMAQIIVASNKPSMDENMPVPEPENPGLDSAADEFMAAIQSNDKSALIESFRAMLELIDEAPSAPEME